MTTNIDRAAEVLWLSEPHLSTSECDDQAREQAQALADAGLLMPDLPEPTIWEQNEEPIWEALGENIQTAGYEGRVIVEDGDDWWEALAVDIRKYALAMLAAADYAERNHHE